MSRDAQRYTKTYSYYRVQPRMEVQYIVDDSLDWKNSVRAASTGNVSLTGSTPLTVDGITIVNGNRVLLKNQGTGSQNGIYVCTITDSSYSLARSLDANSETLSCGAATYVEEGTNAGKVYILSTTNPITVDSTSLTWTELSGGGSTSPGGSDTYVQFNDGGSFGGDADLRFNKTTGALTGTYVVASTGFSGSLTKLTDGTSYLIAGNNITITTGSSGAVTIDSSGGSSSPAYWFSTTNQSTYTTGSVAIRGGLGSVDAASDIGSNVFFFVSGSVTGSGSNDKKAVFGGDVVMSGTLQVSGDVVEITGSLTVTNGISGSLTKLADGTSYLRAGTNITITTGSNGAVTIDSSGGGGVGGTGTVNYIPKFTTTTDIGDSVLSQGVGEGNSIPSLTPFITSSADGLKFTANQNWYFPSSNTSALTINNLFRLSTANGGELGIGTTSVAQRLHAAISTSSTSDPISNDSSRVIRLQNTDASNGNSTAIVNADGSGATVNSYIRFINVNHAKAGAITLGTADGTTEGERFRIDESGNVGIGSVTPTSIGPDVFLFVSGSRNTLGTTTRGVSAFGGDVRVSGSLSVGTGSILITSNDVQFGGLGGLMIQKNGTSLEVKHNQANGPSLGAINVVNSAGNSLLWVSGSGYVGIGTSGASAITNLLKSLGSNVVSIHGPSASALLFEVNDNFSGSITASDSGMIIVPGANRVLSLGSDNSVKMVVENDGDVNIQSADRYFDASIASGQGIRLRSSPGNSDAQVLDCYNESTVQVNLENEDDPGSIILNNAKDDLLVTRVGRLVTICGTIQIADIGGVTGNEGGLLWIQPSSGNFPTPLQDTAVALRTNLYGVDGEVFQSYIKASDAYIYIEYKLGSTVGGAGSFTANGSYLTLMVTYATASS